jgi:uncharacterized protein DUF3276
MEITTGKVIKAGKRTYFFDVKQTKTGEKFLVITESRLVGENKTRKRSAIMVFAETLDEFVNTLSEVARAVSDDVNKKGHVFRRSP